MDDFLSFGSLVSSGLAFSPWIATWLWKRQNATCGLAVHRCYWIRRFWTSGKTEV